MVSGVVLLMVLSEPQLIDVIREACEKDSQKVVAFRIGYSQQIINDILHGRTHISKAMARKFGYIAHKEVITIRTYERIL